jgi:hypothetical protein
VVDVAEMLGDDPLKVGIDHGPVQRPPFADDGYGRNAKLLFSACLRADARGTGLYLHPKHRRSPRRSRRGV